MSDRSPITDPQPGDVVQQGPDGLILTVTKRKPTRVWWIYSTPKGRFEGAENAWNIDGWRDMVCAGANVIKVADSE